MESRPLLLAPVMHTVSSWGLPPALRYCGRVIRPLLPNRLLLPFLRPSPQQQCLTESSPFSARFPATSSQPALSQVAFCAHVFIVLNNAAFEKSTPALSDLSAQLTVPFGSLLTMLVFNAASSSAFGLANYDQFPPPIDEIQGPI